jgi:hypothetical protein
MALAEWIGHSAENHRSLDPGFLQATDLGGDPIIQWRLNRLQADD